MIGSRRLDATLPRTKLRRMRIELVLRILCPLESLFVEANYHMNLKFMPIVFHFCSLKSGITPI